MERQYLRRIVNAINKMEGLYEHQAKFSGANENEATLLYALDDGMPHTQKQLCEDWMLPRTTVNTIIKKWESQGYLELKHVKGTRRLKEICLTQKGREFACEVLSDIYEKEDIAMSETLKECSSKFIDDLELFTSKLEKVFLEN